MAGMIRLFYHLANLQLASASIVGFAVFRKILRFPLRCHFKVWICAIKVALLPTE